MAFSTGVLAGGYVGEVGRTWPAAQKQVPDGAAALYRRWENLWDRLIDACRPGVGAADLMAAYQAAGSRTHRCRWPAVWAWGSTHPSSPGTLPATAADERLEPGMVLAVTGYVWEEGVGAVFGREAVLITADGPEVLYRQPVLAARHAPASNAAGGRSHPVDRRQDADRHDHVSTVPTTSMRRGSLPVCATRSVTGANIDDDVKVLVIRGAGDDLGSGCRPGRGDATS